jgi:heme-degrading monooxygenase HmoA
MAPEVNLRRTGLPSWRRGAEVYIGGDIINRNRSMFIAMNRFKVIKGEEEAFETIWLTRESNLDRMPGFLEFQMLRGPERDDHVLYASHTVWASRAAFEDWTRSDAFRASHRGAGQHRPMYLGHPEFEGFEAIQTLKAPAAHG